MVGNAVPCHLAYCLASAIKEQILGNAASFQSICLSV
jgi:hypothetical protein